MRKKVKGGNDKERVGSIKDNGDTSAFTVRPGREEIAENRQKAGRQMRPEELFTRLYKKYEEHSKIRSQKRQSLNTVSNTSYMNNAAMFHIDYKLI